MLLHRNIIKLQTLVLEETYKSAHNLIQILGSGHSDSLANFS